MHPFANVSGGDVSVKPASWVESRSQDVDSLTSVKGAQLAQRDLRWLLAMGTDFINAELGQADLSHASLYRADFRGARLFAANFEGAYLEDARFQDIDAKSERGRRTFHRADLSYINLAHAKLIGVKLQGIELLS